MRVSVQWFRIDPRVADPTRRGALADQTAERVVHLHVSDVWVWVNGIEWNAKQ